MKLIGKKLITTLFGISAIGGVAAVSFGLTNCGSPETPENSENIENIINDTDVGGPYGGETPSDEQIWTWLIAANPDITSADLQFENVKIVNKTENSCDVTAKPHSGFKGTVHVTYNTTEPIWTLWDSGAAYPTTLNLTSRYVGEATIYPQTIGTYVHHYSFDFVLDDGTAISTPSMGGEDTGYHFANLQLVNIWGYWSLDNKCVRFAGNSNYPGLNIITFDVCRDINLTVVMSMELHLTYLND